MPSGVTLSAAVRQSLLSMQDIASQTNTAQHRLATGRTVSSALDNPVNFFASHALSSRSSDLSGILDSISNVISIVQTANQGITSIAKLVDGARSIAQQALSSKNIHTHGEASSDYVSLDVATPIIRPITRPIYYTHQIAGPIASPDPEDDTPVSFTVDGSIKSISLSSTDTIDIAVDKLNAAAGNPLFSVDGTRIAVDGVGDVAFDDDNGPLLGFAAGGADLHVEDKTRTALAGQFNVLLTQIDQVAKDASYNGVNLLSSNGLSNKLHVSFNEKDTSNLDVQGVDLTSIGLGLSAIPTTGPNANLQNDDDINGVVTKLTLAAAGLRSQASTFGSALLIVQNRQNFATKLIGVLDTGASGLTSADLNEETANSRMLSTRLSLNISSLSLANAAQSGFLHLLR